MMKIIHEELVQNPDLIYELLELVMSEMKEIFPFGRSNDPKLERQFMQTKPSDTLSLRFSQHLSSLDRAKILISEDLVYEDNDRIPYVERYLKGMGVCTEFNLFALMILAKKYNFSARLENIHSD